MTDKRVQFDFEIDFSNGGGLAGRAFRLDIDGDDIADAALADYIVRDLRLLMVGAVRIRNKTILAEPHKRGPDARRFVDLSHTIEDGMITYKGFPAPLVCDHLSHAASRANYAPGTEFQIGRVEMSATRALTSTAPITAMPTATTSPTSRSIRSQRSMPSSCVSPAHTIAQFRAVHSCRATCAARPCSCTPDGTATGAPISISKDIRF